jgi:hypothetical protein
MMAATASRHEILPGTEMATLGTALAATTVLAATRLTGTARETGRQASGIADRTRPVLAVQRLAIAAAAQTIRAVSVLHAFTQTAPPWTHRPQLHVLPLHLGHLDQNLRQHLQHLRMIRGRENGARMQNPFTATLLATTNGEQRRLRAETLSTRFLATRVQHLQLHRVPVDRAIDRAVHRALQGASRRQDTSAIGASPQSTGFKIALCHLEVAQSRHVATGPSAAF